MANDWWFTLMQMKILWQDPFRECLHPLAWLCEMATTISFQTNAGSIQQPTWKVYHIVNHQLMQFSLLTPDWPADQTTWLSFSKSIADHRFHILDVNVVALMGEDLKCIVWPEARCLSCTIPAAKEQYIRTFECQVKWHQLVEWHYDALGTTFESGEASREHKEALEKLDQQRRKSWSMQNVLAGIFIWGRWITPPR